MEDSSSREERREASEASLWTLLLCNDWELGLRGVLRRRDSEQDSERRCEWRDFGNLREEGGRSLKKQNKEGQREVSLRATEWALAWRSPSWLRPHWGSHCCGPDDCRQGEGCIWTCSSWRAATRSAAPGPPRQMMAMNRQNWEEEERRVINKGGEAGPKLAASQITQQGRTGQLQL